ncbi:MAG: WD40 repeat domain-containing protein [Rubripirellula sp.]
MIRTRLFRIGLSLLIFVVCSISVPAVEPPIVALAFAPDGSVLVVGSQAGVSVHDWPSLERRSEIKSRVLNVHDLAFSPSGETLAVAGGTPSEQGVVDLLVWPTGKRVELMNRHDDTTTRVAWLDDKHYAAASLDHEISLVAIGSEKPPAVLRGHSKGVTSLCLVGTTLVSGGWDQNLRVWDSGELRLIRSLNNHTKPIHDIRVQPEVEGPSTRRLLASASADRTVRFWQPTIGRMVRFVRLDHLPMAISWAMDGKRVFAACDDGRVRVIDPGLATVVQELDGVDGWAHSIATHPTDGSVVVGGSAGQLRRIAN